MQLNSKLSKELKSQKWHWNFNTPTKISKQSNFVLIHNLITAWPTYLNAIFEFLGQFFHILFFKKVLIILRSSMKHAAFG